MLNIVLPLGISFYTFQTISYTVDVYRKVIPAEKNFILYGCFVTFFPQLVAGPILRGSELLNQIAAKPVFHLDTFVSGLRRIIFGLFLKVVLADNISPLVDSGFDQPVTNLSAIDVFTLAFLFGFQIYFDFSAYSHIAIGSSRLMGISFQENFNFPYLANSPREFWRRWHISLSSWIRDYLYLPLLGVKVRDRSVGGLTEITVSGNKNLRHPLIALLLTWVIMGFWHGANWTFLIWGLLHASYISVYRLIGAPLSALPKYINLIGGWLITLPLVMLAWIPFRAESLETTFKMYQKLVLPHEWLYLGMRENIYIFAAILLISILGSYIVHAYVIQWLRVRVALSVICDFFLMTITIALVFVFLRPISQFIYFQF